MSIVVVRSFARTSGLATCDRYVAAVKVYAAFGNELAVAKIIVNIHTKSVVNSVRTKEFCQGRWAQQEENLLTLVVSFS